MQCMFYSILLLLKVKSETTELELELAHLVKLTIDDNRPEIQQLIDTWYKENSSINVLGKILAKNKHHRVTKNKIESKVPVNLSPNGAECEIEKRQVTCLHLAAGTGSISLMKLFFKYKVNINILTDKQETALMWAAQYGQVGAIEFLIEQGAAINAEDSSTSTALHCAIEYCNYDTFTLLADTGKADIYSPRRSDGATPLHIAAQTTGSIEIAKKIIEKCSKCKCNARDRSGSTPLMYAAKYANVDVVSALLQKNPDIYHQNHTGDVWHYALSSDKSDEIITNLTNHCRQQRKRRSENNNKHPSTILTERWGQYSKCNGRTMAIVLKPQCVNEEKDSNDNSCLHLAAREGKENIVKEFIRVWKSSDNDHLDETTSETKQTYSLKGIINRKNKSGNTALHLACESGSETILKMLLENEADVTILNEDKEMPLHTASKSENPSVNIIKDLVERLDTESIQKQDKKGNNALDLACTFGRADIILELKDIPIADADRSGCTPLHEAAKLNDPNVLKQVLKVFKKQKGKFDLNNKNKEGETVLHLASKPGFKQEIDYLIKKGASLDIGDNEGNTILHRLVINVAESEGNHTNQLLDLIQFIFEKSVRWWCLRNEYPSHVDDIALMRKTKRNAVIFLTQGVTNNSKLSVIALAFRLGAAPFIELIMNMPNVMRFEIDMTGLVLFDVHNVMKRTVDSLKDRSPTQRPYIELMSDLKCEPERVLNILNIAPIREIEDMYTLICKRTLALLLFLHVIYMTVFSYLGVHIAAQFRNTSDISITDTQFNLAYVIIPLEPLICVMVILAYVQRIFKTEETILRSLPKYLILLVYLTLITVWLVLIAHREPYHDYVLSIALFIGWAGSLSLTRGFKGIHYFYKMLLHMLFNDIIKVLVVYSFVLLAFGFSFHVLLEISSPLVSDNTAGDTLFKTFNLMIGMDEIFTEEFQIAMAEVGRTTGFVRFIYIIYIVLSTIIILNLLIAMMNDSYAKILNEQKGTLRVEAILLGMSIEYMLPSFIRNRLATGKTKFIKYSLGRDMRWCIKLSKRTDINEDHSTKSINSNQTANHFEEETTNKLATLEYKLDEMTKVLASISNKEKTGL